MRFDDLKKNSTSDTPSEVVDMVMRVMPPDVDGMLTGLEFASVEELANAMSVAWYVVATDKWLNSKATQMTIPGAAILLARAKRIMTGANVGRTIMAAAEAMWMRHFEFENLKKRRNAVLSVKRDVKVFQHAERRVRAVYGFGDAEMEHLRYFVCQARKDDADPALNRSLYIYSKEKMTGKTTVARAIAGILNGAGCWRECSGDFFSDIPCELQFGTFERPKATRYACVVMDEAFAGKSTAKYYGKFKTAMTSDKCQVEVKFGGKYDVRCRRNYIFTSNNDISSVVADESERRMCVLSMRKPEAMSYDDIYSLWRDYIVNAPEDPDTAEWYRRTMPAVKGEAGVQSDDIVSALLGDEMRQRVTQAQQAGLYQLAYPKFFTDWLSQSYDVRKLSGLIKEAVVSAYGEPKSSGNRKYYNISELLTIIAGGMVEFPGDNELELPY